MLLWLPWSWSHLADLPWLWLERTWGHVPVLEGHCHTPQASSLQLQLEELDGWCRIPLAGFSLPSLVVV